MPKTEQQKIVDFINREDFNYFQDIKIALPQFGFGDWLLPSLNSFQFANMQLTDSQVEQAVMQLVHKYYKNYDDNVSYQLINLPRSNVPVNFDFKDTFLTLLLFWFIVYILQKLLFTYLRRRDYMSTC